MNTQNERKNEDIAKDIARAAEGIKYGYIQVTIHNSKIVQIDKTEKVRFGPGTIGKGGVSKV